MEKYKKQMPIALFFTLSLFTASLSHNATVFAETEQEATNTAMTMILFLNCNQLPPGMASYKSDFEKKLVQYFDDKGTLREERSLDDNNALVFKVYDENGNITQEKKITQNEMMDSFGPGSPYDQKRKTDFQKDIDSLMSEIKNRIQNGENLNERDSHDEALLDSAIRLGNAEAVRLLIEAGADVNIQNQHGRTPLIEAIGHDDIVQLLIDAKADLNHIYPVSDTTALMEANRFGTNEVKNAYRSRGGRQY
ncbi:peptidase M56 BlaR1 [sediment metagenome]|uniref:Peptidase M56 BlaR1 n=1 Tax=sediment metagenome TaxID=749907 RepID=D9PIK7_9ZZZZ